MSNLCLKFSGNSYQEASRYLGDSNFKGVGYATWMQRNVDGSIGIIHHKTQIIKYNKDMTTVIDCNGYRSRTTADRVRKLTAVDLTTKDGTWYANGVEFYDGMTFQGSKLKEA